MWVGLNPAAVDGHWPNRFRWDETTWQDVIDFYVPQGHIVRRPGQSFSEFKNFYQWIAEGGVWSSYYKLMFRVHLALLEGKKYGKWEDLQSDYKDGDDIDEEAIGDAFLEQYDKNPTLNAELLPFKSQGIQLNEKALLDDERHTAYMKRMFDFIKENSADYAWIIFFGATGFVRALIEKHKPFPSPPEKEYDIGEKGKPGTKFYFWKWENRKMIMSPFLQPYHSNGHDITKLIEEIDKFFKQGGNCDENA